MKRFFGTGMALVFLFQSVAGLGWVVYYYANKARIAAVYCENRDKPQLQCEGKCYLRKKMGLEKSASAVRAEQPAPPLPDSIRQMADLLLFYEQQHAWMLTDAPASASVYSCNAFAEEQLYTPQSFPAGPERPPAIIA